MSIIFSVCGRSTSLLQELGCTMGDDAVTFLSAESLDLSSNLLTCSQCFLVYALLFIRVSFSCGAFAGEGPSLRIASHLPSRDLSQARDIKADMPDAGTHEWESTF